MTHILPVSLQHPALASSEPERSSSKHGEASTIGPRTLLNSKESSAEKRLHRQRVRQLPVNEPSPPVQKPASLWERTQKWILTSYGTRTAIRTLRWMGSSSKATKNRNTDELGVLSDSLHVSDILHRLAPLIAKAVREQPGAELNCMLQKLSPTLESFIDDLLPIMYLNFSKSVQDARGEVEREPVALVEMTSFICAIVIKHLPSIDQKFAAIERIPDGEERNEMISKAFSRLVNEVLEIALPGGINDLPISIPVGKARVWEFLKKNVLAPLFYECYRQVILPLQRK